MTPSSAQRTVAITGGAGGIGQGIAREFVEAGDRVILIDRDAATVGQAAAALGDAASAITLDITDAEAVAATFAGLAAAGTPVDVLVNNAGILSVHGGVTELTPEAYRSILDVNVIGTFTMTQAFARHRIAAGGQGSIVNISSIGGRQPTPGMGAYESSKAAVDSVTRWAAIELAAHSIRVNAVAPGPVLTPMLEMGMPEGSPAREAWSSRIPLGDLARITDIAPAVLFLAGASHITGVSLPVDGGQLLT
ncbi:SDR family oxidoreductase [Leucobacter sp. cx-42]|uniref:SDR family NAD(P)-dependent oxidoreductase n=1 Tax=unclassified Leucobacter TaxID=2621730 RepID=UPI00165E3EE6|nr:MULTISPECIES: SDR family oxidoreductase [unclassified Leucobacter]MBC9953392.1 SDR family oxidoreductase [Leucobacter sp. cx-42]